MFSTVVLWSVSASGCEEPTCPGCDDGDPCTVGECVDDTCVITPRCDDGDPCTVDSCTGDGLCSNVPLCDDGLGCTEDVCNPDGTCTYTPVDSYCDTGRECMTSSCVVMPVPGPGQRVAAGAVPGCFDLLDDGYCTNNWDGCACNGAEMCVGGGGGDVFSGCAPATTRDLWPCDAAASGDGNGCTEETCCEPWDPDGCRLHREIVEAKPDGVNPPLEQFCDAAIGGGDTVSGPTGLGPDE